MKVAAAFTHDRNLDRSFFRPLTQVVLNILGMDIDEFEIEVVSDPKSWAAVITDRRAALPPSPQKLKQRMEQQRGVSASTPRQARSGVDSPDFRLASTPLAYSAATIPFPDATNSSSRRTCVISRSRNASLGFSIAGPTDDMADNGSLEQVIIRQVAPGTPAAEAGLAPGDRVRTIDDMPLTGFTLPKVLDLIRSRGESIKFEVEADPEGLMAQSTQLGSSFYSFPFPLFSHLPSFPFR